MKTKQTLLPSLTKVYDSIDTGFEVSIYRSGTLLKDSKEFSKPIQELLVLDLKMSVGSVNRMFDRMIEEKWTQKRFKDAVDYVEANCKFYPPKPSEFESYDKKIRFNTYAEICEKISLYTPIYSKGTNVPVYILKTEANEFKFPAWDEKYREKSNITDNEAQNIASWQDGQFKERLRG